MKKLLVFLLTMSVSMLIVSCGGDEPGGGENTGGGGNSSGGSGSSQASDSHEYVDLGLPSGTLWASMNVGAKTPYEVGDYFAWGETSPKQSYSLENYKWYDNVTGEYTKYSNKSELELADDAAYVNWGSMWRMATKDQFKELIDECEWQWNENGLLFISKKNNKTLFLPSTFHTSSQEDYCCYWSRTRNTYYCEPYVLSFIYHKVGSNYVVDVSLPMSAHYSGYCVRAVRAY